MTFGEAVTGLAANGTRITLGGTADHSNAAITVGKTDSTHYNVAVNGLVSAGTVTAAVSAAAANRLRR